MTEKQLELIKICRQCHIIYKKADQKFCGNGCELRPPYFINGKNNPNITPREVSLPKTKDFLIRWLCLVCNKEYTADEIQILSFQCSCGANNEFYPFTTKTCGSETCQTNDFPRVLPLEAKVCDLCGQTNFVLNNYDSIKKLVSIKSPTEKSWNGPHHVSFPPIFEKKALDSSLLSCTFTILNNNYEKQIFGDNCKITLRNIIQSAKGFMPDIVYNDLIKQFGIDTPLFSIQFVSDTQSFNLTSLLPLSVAILTKDSVIESYIGEKSPEERISLPENKLLRIQSSFLKINIWVY